LPVLFFLAEPALEFVPYRAEYTGQRGAVILAPQVSPSAAFVGIFNVLKCKRCFDFWQHALQWCEEHAGLGGWVGAVGAIFAILAAWWLARSEYLRTQQLEDARVNTEISLISRTASEFDATMVQRYLVLLKANEPTATGYYNNHLNDSQMSRMVDFSAMPIIQWPSVESYDAFKRYFISSIQLMETSVDVNKSVSVEQRRQDYDGTLNILQKTLNAARK
jgi:hypothetical protein